MITENYDSFLSLVTKPQTTPTHIYAWLGVEPGNWNFLKQIGGDPFNFIYAVPISWKFGNPVPLPYLGICRHFQIEEQTRKKIQRVAIFCEFIIRNDYAPQKAGELQSNYICIESTRIPEWLQ